MEGAIGGTLDWMPNIGLWGTVGTLLLGLLLFYLTWHYIVYSNNRGPTLYPFVGNLVSIYHHFDHHFDRHVAFLEDSPNLSYFTAGPWSKEVVTANPQHIQHILKDNFSNYPKGPLFREAFEEVVGEGIFTSDGEAWHQQRKVASYEFSTNSIRGMTLSTSHAEMQQRLFPALDAAASSGTPLDIQDILLRFNFDSICKIGFGYDPEALSPGLPAVPLFQSMTRAVQIVMVRVFIPRVIWRTMRVLNLGFEAELKKHVRVIDDVAQRIINQRRAELAAREEIRKGVEEALPEERSDILSRMIYLGEKDHGQLFSDRFLRDTCISFLFAGRDSSALAVAWLLWALTCHPRVEEKVLEELRAVIARRAEKERSSLFTYDEMRGMNYMHAVINESLRLYPTVPTNFKTAVAADRMPDGTYVGKGWYVTYPIYAVGRMKRIWGEDALDFNPERWLTPDGQVKQESPFKFLVFNAGPRLCLGREMAYIQMKSLISNILMRYQLELVPGHVVHYVPATVLHMKYGLQMTLRRRP